MKNKWYTYWWKIDDENSAWDGVEFFTELKSDSFFDHQKHAKEYFKENLKCYGKIDRFLADVMGLDTY